MAHIVTRERKDGTKSYVVKWRDPDRTFREKTFRTKAEARGHANAVEAAKQSGGYIDDRKGTLTVREVAEEWLPTRVRKARTNAEYRRILESRVYPKFGHRQVASIKVADCVAFRDALMKDGLRPATVTKVFGMLNTVLAYAKRRRYIYDNPAADVGMPDNTSAEVTAFEGRYLTPDEFQKLVESAEFFNPMYGLVVRLLGTTGMRVGELAGLNIGDVHILGSRGYLDVHRTYDARYGLSESPKTDRSNRKVTLVPDVVPAVAAYLAQHPRLGEADAPLFLSRVVGGAYMNDMTIKLDPSSRHVPSDAERPFDPSRRFDGAAFYRRVWTRAVGMAGVAPLRIHDLRHTAASFMLSSGMPMTMVSRQLGHSSTSTTDLIYGGLLRNSLDEAVDNYGDWLASQAQVGLGSRVADRAVSVV